MAKRKRGRPTLPKAERKRGILAFRARDDLRQWLTDAAKLSGRSVSEEIEYRLEQSRLREGISEEVKAQLVKIKDEVVQAMAARVGWDRPLSALQEEQVRTIAMLISRSR